MKTITNLKGVLAILFLVGLSVNTFANVEPGMKAFQDKPETQLKFDIPVNDNTYITIYDTEGNSIFSDMFSPKNKTSKVFDFASVSDGTYTMITDNKYTTLEKTIELKDRQVTIIEKDITYRPVFSLDGDLLKVNYLNANKGDISITLESSAWIHLDKKVGNQMAYGEILNLKNLPKGEYTFTLKVDSSEYTYNFYK